MATNITKTHETAPLPSTLQSLLGGVRVRIRAYVCLEGLAIAAIWLGLMFWIGLALDYFPVLLGGGEMPRLARGLLLGVVGLVVLLLLYRFVLRRVFAALSNRSLALLIERRYRAFRGSLVTVVELGAGEKNPNATVGEHMLAGALRSAEEVSREVRLRRLFQLTPLALRCVVATLLAASIAAFFFAAPAYAALAARRLYALSNETWPRNAHIELLGMDVLRPPPPPEIAAFASYLNSNKKTFVERRIRVARGSDLALHVRADASAAVIPEVCTIYYRTASGLRGRANMQRVGNAVEGYQLYRFDGEPFRSMLENVEFDVVGFDHRQRNYMVEVVDGPVLYRTDLECRFPEYMVNREQGLWLPRVLELRSGAQLPQGATIRFRVATNKPLRAVQVLDPATGEQIPVQIFNTTNSETENNAAANATTTNSGVANSTASLPGAALRELESASGFTFEIESLPGRLVLFVSLLDADNLLSDSWTRLTLHGVEDQPPQVDVAIRGIGSAITPDARLPAVGRIEDDYQTERTWFDIKLGDGQIVEREILLPRDGLVKAALDFQNEREQGEGGIKLAVDTRITVQIKAADKKNILGGPNIGAGEQFHLDVVPPNRLIAMLEARELSLRRRFEQIIEEVSELRDLLRRVSVDKVNDLQGQLGEDALSDEAALRRFTALRELRVQRSLQQTRKSSQEVLGVAASFEDIREELENNRIDTQERKDRLQLMIADPLQEIGEVSFSVLEKQLVALAGALENEGRRPQLTQASLEQAETILLEMEAVLRNMLELETYNELLDIVRGLMKDQSELIDATKKQQKRQVLDLFK